MGNILKDHECPVKFRKPNQKGEFEYAQIPPFHIPNLFNLQ